MKNLFKIIFLLLIFFIIIALFLYVISYSKECINSISSVNEYVRKIEKEKLEISNDEMSIQVKENVQEQIVIEKPGKNEKFGTLKIPSIDVELDMLNGTSKNLLSQGVGIDDESYFPGEGGSVILMGHNFKQFLARLPDTKTGDEVIIETAYGEFHYTIYDAKVVKETDVNEVPIQKDEEIVMIYTCWPIPNVTHANDRYVIYAK